MRNQEAILRRMNSIEYEFKELKKLIQPPKFPTNISTYDYYPGFAIPNQNRGRLEAHTETRMGA